MPSAEDIAHQKNLLEINRRNLAHYIKQQQTLGEAYTPPGVINGISETRRNIQQIKDTLNRWGIQVENHPNDIEQSQASPPAPSPSAPGGGGVTIHVEKGDFRGSSFGNTVGGDLRHQTGAPNMSNVFNQEGWKVEGNVYNIAGDLNIGTNAGKDEFLAALRQFKQEMDKAKDLPADDAADMNTNLNAAIEAAERPQPNKDRAVKKLTEVKGLLDGLKNNFSSALALGHLVGQILQAAQNIRF